MSRERIYRKPCKRLRDQARKQKNAMQMFNLYCQLFSMGDHNA